MSNINIRRAVDNIRSGTTIYTPLIELIVNGIQAIAATGAEEGQIDVTILREGANDLIDQLRPVHGFAVTDDGIGFDAQNREAFDAFYTDNKALEGGKGFGRFTCLRYFSDVRGRQRLPGRRGLLAAHLHHGVGPRDYCQRSRRHHR